MFVPEFEGLVETGSEEFSLVDIDHASDLVLVGAVRFEFFFQYNEV